MHVLRSSPVAKRSARLLSLLFACAVAGILPGTADTAEDPAITNSAMVAAQHWLDEIDAGHYDQSYAEGCLAFHNKVSQDQWTTVLKSIRPLAGTVLTRKVASHSYKPDGFEGLQGECMVITYNSSFSKISSELEVVVLKREDGKWRGAGYNAQPQADPQNDVDTSTPSEQTTETTQTTSH